MVQILSAAILIGLLVFFRDSGAVRGIENAAARFIFPFSEFAENLKRSIGGLFLSTPEYPEALQNENIRLRALEFEVEVLREENEELRKISGVGDNNLLPVRGARVVSYRRELGKELLFIDAGSDQGIHEGNIVADPNLFLVGTVSEVQAGFSKVEIASNSGEVLRAEIIPFRIPVTALGLGARAFALEALPRDAVVRVGDLVTVPLYGGKRIFLGSVTARGNGVSGAFGEARAILISHPETLRIVSVFIGTP